ncbi:LysR family transcriptional regulator [Pararobbsia silviterrae]|uniref:LysR family transcriptional regulator n=1 Tax=Pararobbsia silviterrae TaxID=1792498 RepID=A0A494XZL9_9BURK|nr:LysR family transcriptional regulator [Pararobbsia silviterrae]RKP55962.1 LysR family transcriptional regulator [Pararobbsia silviterrae]
MDRLFAMKVFVRVVETGSFTRAAQALDLPGPTVSRLVQSLEAHLGARLLSRTTRSVKATEEGLAYYERCIQVLNEIEDMEADLGHSRRVASGRVRVSLPTSIAKHVLIPSLPEFFAAHPDVRIDLVISDRPVDLVSEAIDCAIRVGELNNEGVVSRTAGEVWTRVCASPAYLERYGEPKTLAELHDHIGVNYISQVTGRVRPWSFVIDGKPHAVQMKSLVTVDDADAYVECGVAGLGIVSSSSYLLQRHTRTGALKRILTQYKISPRPIHVIYMPNRHLPRKTRVFIDWFCEMYAALMAKSD